MTESELNEILAKNPALKLKGNNSVQKQIIPMNQVSEVTETSTKSRKKYEYAEFKLQVMVCKYLQFKYPNVLFESSPINLNLTASQRKMMSAINKKNFHPPDMKIYFANHGCHSLFLELKKESPYLKDGITLKKSEHLENQWKSILQLREVGYYADFFWDFDQIKQKLNWYLEK